MPQLADSSKVLFAVCLIAAAGLPACSSNPLFPADSDYGLKVREERLKQIDRANLSEYSTGQRPKDVNPTREQAEEALSKKFDNLAVYELPITEARKSALSRNLDLQVALVDPAIARENITREDAAFESIFNLRTLIADGDEPTASALDNGQSNVRQIEPSFTVPLRTGERFTVSAPIQRTKRDNQFSTLNPAYTSDLQFSLSQPLLRNAGRRANTAALRIASYEAQASQAQTKLEAIRQLAAVDRSYWRLYGARTALDVSIQQYELAVAQMDRAQRQVDRGALPEVEVIRAQSGVADRIQAIIQSQTDVLTNQRELKRIINMPGLNVDTDTLLVPSDAPDPVRYEFDVRELCDAAVAHRMEMLDLELRLAADAARIDFNQNQALPLVTLDYAYRINGLGSSGQDAFRNLEGNDFEGWSIGLNAEIPLGNEAARSAVRQAILQRLQRLHSKDAREQSIRQEVLAAVDQINSAWQRILAARASVMLNTRALRAEERQFEVGNSTSNDVLDAQARLAEAQLQEIRAIVDYEIAQVDLAFATGTLLGSEKVSLDEVAPPDADDPAPAEEIPSEAVNQLKDSTLPPSQPPTPAANPMETPVLNQPEGTPPEPADESSEGRAGDAASSQ